MVKVAAEGKRAINRRERLARIQEAALTLFLSKGYDETTIDDIASSAGVSRRNFFHYFNSKEEVALDWMNLYCDMLVECIADRPACENVATTITAAVLKTFESARPGSSGVLQLVAETPSLFRSFYARHSEMELRVSEALFGRGGYSQFDCDLIAMTFVGMLRLNGVRWIRETQPPSARTSFVEAVDRLRRLIGELDLPPLP